MGKQTGVSGGINGITCNGENGEYCVAVGGYSAPKSHIAPIVYTSSDSGKSWAPNYPESFGTYGTVLQAVSCSGSNGQYCTAVGNHSSSRDGKIYNATSFLAYTSIDGGINWTVKVIDEHIGGSGASLQSVTCNNNGQNCIAVGFLKEPHKPIIYRTANGGDDRTSYIPESTEGGALNAVTCSQNNDQYCMAAGEKNSVPIIYKSIDGGSSWVIQDNLPRHYKGTFNAITCNNNGEYCTAIGYVSAGGRQPTWQWEPISFVTYDGGNNWWHRFSAFANQDDAVRNIYVPYGLAVSGNSE